MSNNNYVSIPGSILAAGSATSDLQAAGNAPLSSLDAKLTLIIDTLEASDAVTDAQLRASPIPVSGVFFQATQPVSLALAPTTPVTGTFWQATQPVSGPATDAQLRASPIPISGTVTTNVGSGTQPVSIASMPSTPVTGAFFQATQPVSLSSAPTTPVTGTFWQATQPVSVTSVPTTPVTGTFWQVTQPVSGTVTANAGSGTQAVSGPATDAQLRASPLPVSGTVAATQSGTWTVQPGNTANTTAWKVDGSAVTQPVSGTITANVGSGTQPVSGTFWQATQPVSGSFFQATQPVSLAVAPTTPVTGTFWQATQPVSGTFFQATQPISGTVTANAGTGTMAVSLAVAPTTPVTGTFWQATQPVSGTVTVTPPTLTKGTQGATGFSTQDLKDAGRNQTNFFMAIQIVTTGTDALLALTGYKSGATVGATATPAVVTAGKTYRITSVTMSYTTIITTPGSVRFTLRANLSGTVLIGSPAVCNWEVGEPTGIAPVAGKKNTVHLTFPDGMEFAAGTGIGISQVGLNTVGAAAAVGYGQITLHGYEY